jgi:hypothetical protein
MSYGYVKTPRKITGPVLEAALLQSLRHQFRLEDDAFYMDQAPDGTAIRRVPRELQARVQRELRTRYTDQVQQTAHDLFKGQMGLQAFIATALEANGYQGKVDLRTPDGIRAAFSVWASQEPIFRAEGSSNAGLSNALANVMNKFALQGYLFGEQSWREFCAIRPVTDFKPSKSINLLGDFTFKQVGSAGELANAVVGDQAFSNQAAPYGRILTLPWTHIVNDDLGILASAPQKLGQGAILSLNDAIWVLWAAMAAGTVNGDDGAAFWNSTGNPAVHTSTPPAGQKKATANKISGGSSALSSSSLKTAKALFDNQVDPNGFPLGFNGAMPRLLFGPTNWVTAVELLTYRELVGTGQTATPKQPNGNVWAGTMKPVMSRYIENATYVNSATPWWVLADPVALAAIEVCFLNGVDTPEVLQAGPDYQFDRLGISIRGTMPFGVTQQNFRAGVYSVGA